MEYKIIFANESIDTKKRYSLFRETKMYWFFKEWGCDFIFRIHKNTLNMKGIKEGANGYRWDIPTPISVIEISN